METPEKYYLGVPQDMRAELTSCGSRSQRVRGIAQAEEAGAGIHSRCKDLMVPRHVTTGRTEPCNTLRLLSQGLLEEAGEMHPNNLTSVHYTKRMPKWQQTNKNDADQVLV